MSVMRKYCYQSLILLALFIIAAGCVTLLWHRGDASNRPLTSEEITEMSLVFGAPESFT